MTRSPVTHTLACLAAAMALVAATADAPASAKGPVSVTVTGPRVPHVRLVYTQTATDVDSATLADATDLWALYDGRPLAEAPGLPSSRLGPRYVVSWEFGEDETVVQHVYPFAGRTGWVRTLPGQTLFLVRASTGWSRGRDGMRAEFRKLGATRVSPVAAPGSPRAEAEAGSPRAEAEAGSPGAEAEAGSPGRSKTSGVELPVLLTSGGLLAVLAAAAAAGWRRRLLTRRIAALTRSSAP